MMIPLLHLGMIMVGVPYSVEGMIHTEARDGTRTVRPQSQGPKANWLPRPGTSQSGDFTYTGRFTGRKTFCVKRYAFQPKRKTCNGTRINYFPELRMEERACSTNARRERLRISPAMRPALVQSNDFGNSTSGRSTKSRVRVGRK